MKNSKVLSLAGGGGPLSTGKSSLTGSQQAKLWDPVDPGFTMAEILLSLTIIGVVAAITLPSLTGNINERTWNTQRKALYARFSQAISLMPALNGYGTLTAGDSSNSAVDTAAETFVTDGLSKVLKINNICDSEHLEDCGIATKYNNMKGGVIDNFTSTMNTLVKYNEMFNGVYSYTDGNINQYHQTDTKAAAFETANGESILVYYNPYCKSSLNIVDFDYTQPYMCANFIYDLNGSKGPNTMGKDVGFIAAIYPSDTHVVAPMPDIYDGKKGYQNGAAKYCTDKNSESRLPNLEELMAMFYNRRLLANDGSEGASSWTNFFWSSTLGERPNAAYHLRFTSGSRHLGDRNNDSMSIWCIKR